MESVIEKNTSELASASRNKYREIVQKLLSHADIQINGNRPEDITVLDERFFRRFIRDGTLGLGETYVEGWWECERIDELITRFLNADLLNKIDKDLKFIYYFLKAKLINEGKASRAFEIGEKHYDFGNDLFQAMLDKRMIYSCALWNKAQNIDEAQEHKLELICQKLGLKKGMRLLDIGCGWGGLAKYAVEKYDVNVVGITVSKNQLELAKQICDRLPIDLRLQDYRDLNEKFDRIVSVGMFEHVCPPNYKVYMEVANQCLDEGGLFLLHTHGRNESISKPDGPWTRKYIFPNSEVPTLKQIGQAIEGLFILEDLHNIGADYDNTLLAWHEKFIQNWDQIKSRYSEKFFRLWKYFLLFSAGTFRSRYFQIWQMVLSKGGIEGGYHRRFNYNFSD